MKKYYITYGNGGDMPFKGGWSTIYAKEESEARQMHVNRHGLSENGCLRFAFSYSEEEFEKTGMKTAGNFGAYEHESIGKEEYMRELERDFIKYELENPTQLWNSEEIKGD